MMEPCFGILFWFCLALGFFGIATATIGIVVHLVYTNGEGFVEFSFLSAPALLITIGVIIFFVAFLGCCGASKKNYSLLMIFGILMLVLFVLGFAGGVACYINRNQLENNLENSFNDTMQNYTNNMVIQKTWNIMQHDLECCGMYGPDDWNNIFHNDSIPSSCCKEIPMSDDNKFDCVKENAYSDGCMPLLLDILKKKISILGIAAAVVAGIQIIIVIFTCYLAGTIRREYQTV